MTNLIGKKCVFRGDRSGVFFGELADKNGQEVEIKNCRRLWYWDGACSISEISLSGVKNPNNCKFTVTVESLVITDCIEIDVCTEKAIENIESVKVWNY